MTLSGFGLNRRAFCRKGESHASRLRHVISASIVSKRQDHPLFISAIRRAPHALASARRPSRLVKSKSAWRRAACIARLTCRQAVRRAAVATRALAARVNLWTVVRTGRATSRSVRTVKTSARFQDGMSIAGRQRSTQNQSLPQILRPRASLVLLRNRHPGFDEINAHCSFARHRGLIR